MSGFSTIKFTANTIDGNIEEFPVTFDLLCKSVQPIGVNIIRQFNSNECIRAIKVFIVYYRGQNLGSTQFKSMSEFLQYFQSVCQTPKFCGITYNGCDLTYNSCNLKYIN